jgi:hypothetical protein
MFHRLLDLRKDDEGDAKGAVFTGQPGIGASLSPDLHTPCNNSPAHPFSRKPTFLKSMLPRLVPARHVVLLCGTSEVYHFYSGQVYSVRFDKGSSLAVLRLSAICVFCPSTMTFEADWGSSLMGRRSLPLMTRRSTRC